MAAYECIAGFVTGVGAVMTDWTLAAGDSLRIRGTPGTPFLLNVWTDVVGVGTLTITSPKLHDITNALSFNTIGNGEPLKSNYLMERLFPNDVLRVRQSGSAGLGDIDSGTLCIYYDSLPGLDQNLITWKEFRRRYLRQMCAAALVTPSMVGGYGPPVAGGPGQGPDFRGNTEYACMGYTHNDLPVGTVTFKGPDTANLRIPLPQSGDDLHYTSEWFLLMAQRHPELPMIPVINSMNRQNIQVESVHSSVILPAGTAFFQLAQLS